MTGSSECKVACPNTACEGKVSVAYKWTYCYRTSSEPEEWFVEELTDTNLDTEGVFECDECGLIDTLTPNGGDALYERVWEEVNDQAGLDMPWFTDPNDYPDSEDR